MAETKTRPTGVSVDEYLAAKASPEQLVDCKAIMAMCIRVTRQPAKMWGPSIVGFGVYQYRYDERTLRRSASYRPCCPWPGVGHLHQLRRS